MFNYIRRHWRGELSLGISYWLNSFLGNLIAFAAIFAINSVIEDTLKPVLILAGLIVNYALLSAITIWIITGTWRSAINHKEKTGRKVWATVAQFMLILGVIQFATAMVDGTKKITEVAKIVAGTDEISEFELKLIGGTVLQINGYITFQMIDDVDNYLKYNTNIKAIHLNSGGGRIGPARYIRDLILAKNLNTYTDTGCLSACTVAFIAGKKRVVAVGAKLGFHQFDFVGTSRAEMRVEEQHEIDFFRDRGVPKSFARKAFGTPNNQMWYPTYRELMEANVVTHIVIEKEFIPIKKYCRIENCDSISSAPQWLQKTAAQLNQTLPKKIDWLTRLDHALSGPGKHFTYNYTILTEQSVDFDIISTRTKKIACGSKDLKSFFENGVTMHWLYRDRAGKRLYETIVSPSDCSDLATVPQ